MKRTKRKLIIICIVVFIAAWLSVFLFNVYERSVYKKHAGKELFYGTNNIEVDYMDKTVDMRGLDNSSLITQLQYRDRELYFKKINSDEYISIISSSGTVVNIFQRDSKSVFLQLKIPDNLDLQYIIYDINLNDFLDILYKISNNNIFKSE